MGDKNWKAIGTCVYFGDGGIDISRAPDAENRANIIASAPALLDALESARTFIFRHAQSDCNTGELICKKTEAELIKIDAAIKLARGE